MKGTLHKLPIRKALSPQFLFANWLYILVIPYLLLVTLLEYKRIPAFGCFDDCANYMAAYFMIKGKHLYSEIFTNHQMLAVYISFLVQKLLHPQSITKLLLYHRLLVFGWAIFMDMFLIYRFRKTGLGFVFLYELPKLYLFGSRFLAESFIVYPLVYLFGLIWYRMEKKTLFTWEYYLAAIFTWFIVFMREPYVPLALFMFFVLFLFIPNKKIKIVSSFILIALSMITLATVSIPDYIFNVFTVTKQTVAKDELISSNLFGIGSLKSFGYPLYMLFSGNWNPFHLFLIGLDAVFLVSTGFFLRQKRYRYVFLIVIVLGFANLRVVEPGRTFYEAFHMNQWYGLFVMAIFFMISLFWKNYKTITRLFFLVLAFSLIFLIVAPSSMVFEKVDRQTQFITNYGNYLVIGTVIKSLSKPGNTMFVDHWDDLIYFQAGLPSAYPYSWYTSVMPLFNVYRQAKLQMFAKNPPDFFYGFCPAGESKRNVIPKIRKNDYEQLYFRDNATCLFIKKVDIATISKDQWRSVAQYQFHLFKR